MDRHARATYNPCLLNPPSRPPSTLSVDGLIRNEGQPRTSPSEVYSSACYNVNLWKIPQDPDDAYEFVDRDNFRNLPILPICIRKSLSNTPRPG
jgi:hypothetical protein